MMYTYSFNIFLTGYPELKFATVILRAKKASEKYKEIIIKDYDADGSEHIYTSVHELFQKNKDITPDTCIFYPIPDLRSWYEAGLIENYVPVEDKPWKNIMVEFFQENKDISHATCFFYWLMEQSIVHGISFGTFFSPENLYWKLTRPEIWYNCTLLETDDPAFSRDQSANSDDERDKDDGNKDDKDIIKSRPYSSPPPEIRY